MMARRKLVAFQGERGAFSEDAVRQMFPPDTELLPCQSFEMLFSAVTENAAHFAVAPLENTLAGSVQRCYDLLLENSLFILGETIVPIAHHLIGCQGATVSMIRTVESHPVALAQCERFFAMHPDIRAVASEDTAGSVRRVVEKRDLTVAAIAGSGAAAVYGGKILAEHLEDNLENYTRFVVLARESEIPPDADKLSLVFALPHRPGVLSQALEPFARRGIDLLKIESRPVKGKPWEYRFYLDLHASTHTPHVGAALKELRSLTQELRILGCYPSAKSQQQINTRESVVK
ncbi:MAG TPA: prephenate dehydratase [Terriglobales bacterium]|nr:prephenate dehydratase [Terriglobales bacterium]